MLLKDCIEKKKIGDRKQYISEYLKKSPIGFLNDEDVESFKVLFEKYYFPDENQVKFEKDEIEEVKIDTIKPYNTKCFQILVKNNYWNVKKDKLAGTKANNNNNMKRALRYAIADDIHEFRRKNPLNPKEICPITKKEIGLDAEVDHKPPKEFSNLQKEWKKTVKSDIVITYDNDKKEYILDNQSEKSWKKYHRNNAELRYLSKEGNRILNVI